MKRAEEARPKIGLDGALKELNDEAWLSAALIELVFGSLNDRSSRFLAGRPERRLLLLCGAPGMGKTTLAHVAAVRLAIAEAGIACGSEENQN